MSEKSRLLSRPQPSRQTTTLTERENASGLPGNVRPAEVAGLAAPSDAGATGHSFKHISLGPQTLPSASSAPVVQRQATAGPGRTANLGKTVQISGAGQQFNPVAVPSGGGVIQCQGKGNKKKKPKQKSQKDKDRQKKAGLNLGSAMDRTGASEFVKRKGHTKGSKGTSGSSRDQIHSHGDTVAIKAAKNKAIHQLGISRQEFQSSAQRKGTKKKSKDERLDEQDQLKLNANFIKGKRLGPRKKESVVERDPFMEEFRRLQLEKWNREEAQREDHKGDTDTDEEQDLDVPDEHPEFHQTQRKDESDDDGNHGGGGGFGVGNEILVEGN